MTDIFAPVEDATPIQPDDRKKLIPTWITTRDDLNAAEAANIDSGLAWAKRRRPKPLAIATDSFSLSLHKMMFGKVWKWAGKYRDIELEKIGLPSRQIGSRCAELFDQYRYWIEHETFDADEIAVRLHHQLVFVHPFVNGNGRHTRMMADLLVESLGREAFGWGHGNLQDNTSALRSAYIATLKKADKSDYSDLIAFARS